MIKHFAPILIFAHATLAFAEVPDDVRGSPPAMSRRVQSRCALFLQGRLVYKGRCGISREPNDNVTEIVPTDGSGVRYFIVRDDNNPAIGVFKSKLGDAPAETLGDIVSRGDCWKGLRVTFCAE